MLTKTRPLRGARSSIAPAPAIYTVCLEWGGSSVPLKEGRVWCALPRKVWCAFHKGESGVPPLERRIWCALSRKRGSGVPSPPNVCYSLFTRGVALVNTKLSPSCLINKLWRSSYRASRMATPHACTVYISVSRCCFTLIPGGRIPLKSQLLGIKMFLFKFSI